MRKSDITKCQRPATKFLIRLLPPDNDESEINTLYNQHSSRITLGPLHHTHCDNFSLRSRSDTDNENPQIGIYLIAVSRLEKINYFHSSIIIVSACLKSEVFRIPLG